MHSLIVTGHSLGAGTAVLIALHFLHQKEDPVCAAKIECIALAPPPVYLSSSPLPPEISERITCYINNHDCVPRLSLGSAAKLVAILRAIDELSFYPGEIAELLTGKSRRADKLRRNAKLTLLRQTVETTTQDEFPYLKHVGRIRFLHRFQMKDLEKQERQGDEEEAEKETEEIDETDDDDEDEETEENEKNDENNVKKNVSTTKKVRRFVVLEQPGTIFSGSVNIIGRMMRDHMGKNYLRAIHNALQNTLRL